MRNRKPIHRRLFVITMVLAVIVAVAIFLLPHLFQLSPVRNKTSAFLSNQTGGNVSFRSQKLTLFPEPRIHLYDVRLENEGSYAAVVDHISAAPDLFSLLRGRFNFARVTLTGAAFTVNLPDAAIPPSPAAMLAALRQNLASWMDMLEPVGQKNFILDIDGGSLTLVRTEKPPLSIRLFHAGLNWQRPVISLHLGSSADLWRRSELTLGMDVTTRDISGRLAAEDLTPRPLWDSLFPNAPLRLEEAALDANLSWETRDFKTWRLSVDAGTPVITFRREEEAFHLRGKKAAGEIRFDETGIHAAISELDLASPALRLTGGFDLDTELPSAGWQATVETMDIASTRAAALFFADRFRTTRNISRILRDGRVSQLTLGQEAQTLAGLKDVSTFHLRGLLEDATLFVPKPDLLLTESFGNVTVLDGVLDATDVSTRLGNSTGSLGSFTRVLHGKKPKPWTAAIDIHADVAQLPPLLERLTNNTAFAREMAGIDATKGSAEGALVLDYNPDGLRVMVDVANFDLSADYHRIPLPLALSGGGFTYRNGGIRVEEIEGSLGASRFSGLTAALSWKTAPHLTISSARAEADAEELLSWFVSPPAACRNAEKSASGAGRLILESLQFEGPLKRPEAWRFQTEGQVSETMDLCIPSLPENLSLYRGGFSANQEGIDIFDADLSFLGARLSSAVSLKGWIGNTPRIIDATVRGTLNRDISDWIGTRFGIPETLKWRTPIALAPLVLHWHETEGLAVSADTTIHDNGPRLSFNLRKTGDALDIDRLEILDGDVHAAAALSLGTDAMTATFSGVLGHDTVSAVLEENRLLTGSLQGNFSARCDLSPPFLAGMDGRLQVTGLDLTPTDLPLIVSRASLAGTGASVNIENARLTWKERGYALSGGATRTRDNLLLDLALTTGQIDWAEIKPLMDRSAAPDTPFNPYLRGNIGFVCDRLVLNPILSFEPFDAELELAENRIDIVFQKADLCGIFLPGSISFTPNQVLFSFTPSAGSQPLEPSITCLRKGKILMDGHYDLSGDLSFEWDRRRSFWESIDGAVSLSAEEGRIYRAVMLGKLFSLLNIQEILSGQLPDLEKDGFPYNTATFSGRFMDGRFELASGLIDSPAMTIFFEGFEDYINREHDLTLVVAPLKTVDALVDKIPVINEVLEKGLVFYPVEVTGSWDDPQLMLLSPTAVGNEVMGIMERTLRLPLTILEKLFPAAATDEGDSAED